MTPLHLIGRAIRGWLSDIPLPFVRVLMVLSLVVLLIWVLRLPTSRTTPPTGTGRWDENLKFGAALALVIQILIYWLI